MEQHQAPIIDFPGFVFRTGRGRADTDVAFVGDLNFSIIYQLNRVWGLRTGYNLIWLEGVALRPISWISRTRRTAAAALTTAAVCCCTA